MMRTLILFLLQLSIPSDAISYFRYSVLITQTDLGPGNTIDSGFQDESYRVYGTYASQARSSDFTRNIFIKGSSTVSLYDLADSNTTTNLLPHVVMKSPIVITDNNTAQTARYPFTIWIVTIDKLMPVYDAKSMNGLISPEDTIAYGGITVLSAEPFFNMYAFTMRTLTYMQFATCGYDAYLNEYQVMKIETNDYGPSSFGSFSTPILTLFTESYSVYTKFSFTFDKDNRFGLHTLNTKSTTAAISPGWLNSTQSFPYEYPIAPFSNNSFKFNENRVLLILIKADGFLPGESLLVQAGTQDDQTYQNWSITTPMDKSCQSYGNIVRVFLTSPSSNHTPRYRVQISSHASDVHDFLHFLVIYTFFLVLT